MVDCHDSDEPEARIIQRRIQDRVSSGNEGRALVGVLGGGCGRVIFVGGVAPLGPGGGSDPVSLPPPLPSNV